ncbi:MAG: hypothetical protein NZL89_07040, partial [Leptospiraceae bacterium]|nr:hypothetical protein [Leptospiraceae bacterium]
MSQASLFSRNPTLFTIAFAVAMLSLSPLAAEPIGWGDPILVASGIEEYGVCCHEGEKRLYAVATKLKAPFRADAATTVELWLYYTHAGGFADRLLAEIVQAPAEQLFPVYPSVSALGEEILVSWQEVSPQGNASGIYYLYSANGPEGFGTKQLLPTSAGRLNAILPSAKITAPGRQVIFYQEPAAANRFRLVAAQGVRGVFASVSTVAEISGGTRGSLFPATLRRGNRIDLFYQNRAETTFIDDIFRVHSPDAGASWTGHSRVTSNGFQNFSARVTNWRDRLMWIWQSNPNKIWSVFAAQE